MVTNDSYIPGYDVPRLQRPAQVIDRFRGEYGFLSNFYTCNIFYEGLHYTSVEAAYQAQKCPECTKRFSFMTAKQAKGESKCITVRSDWHEVRVGIMHELLRLKFQEHTLLDQLLDTYPTKLVEGNTWGDTFWGEYYGHGENNLGKLLEAVRWEYMMAETLKYRLLVQEGYPQTRLLRPMWDEVFASTDTRELKEQVSPTLLKWVKGGIPNVV